MKRLIPVLLALRAAARAGSSARDGACSHRSSTHCQHL